MTISALLFLAAAGATVPPGTTIADGMTLAIDGEGIEFLGQQASNILDQHAPLQMSNSISCGFDTIDYTVFPGSTTNSLDIEFGDFTLTPYDGAIRLGFDGTGSGTGVEAGLNHVVARYSFSGCGCSCNGSIKLPVTDFTGELFATLLVATNGEPHLDIQNLALEVDAPSLSYTGCSPSGPCGFVLGLWVDDVAGAMANQAETEIETYIEKTSLPLLNDALATLLIGGVADVGGTPIAVDVVPTAVSITSSAGIVFSASTTVTALAASPCVAAGGGVDPVAPGAAVPASASAARLSIAGDAINQALYAAWQGGALCRTIEEIDETRLTLGSIAVPELLAAAAELGLTDSTALALELRPASAPTAVLDGTEPAVSIEGLEVRFLAKLEERVVRLASVSVDATLSVGLALEGETSTRLRISSIDVDSLAASASYDEIVGEEVSAALAATLEGVLSAWVPLIAETLPSADLGKHGIRLRDLEVTTGGGALHLDAGLAPEGGGCAAATPGGCGVESCSLASRRSRGPFGSGGVFALALLIVAARRRAGR